MMNNKSTCFIVVIGLIVSCTSKPVDIETIESVDLNKLTFCDCKSTIFDIKGELQQPTDST